MGAFASALGAGPNYALQIIDKATDDDIRAQIANIDKKKGDLTELQKLYKLTLDQTGDKIAAEDAMRLAAHSAIDSKLAEAQQTAKSEVAASKVQELRAQYELKRVEREAALSERTNGTEAMNFKVIPATSGGMAGGTDKAKLLAMQRDLVSTSHGQAAMDLAAGGKGGGKAETATLGGQLYELTAVTSAAEGAKVRDKMLSLKGMDEWLAEADKARQQYGANLISKAKLDNAIQRYANALSAAEGQGIVKKEELELMREAMTSLSQGKDVISDLRMSHNRTREGLLEQYGAVPVRRR
jgi:hypothetical protein